MILRFSLPLFRMCGVCASVLIILVLIHPSASAQKKSQAASLLWEISGNGLAQPSYLYGTMHVRDRRVFDFADSVLIDFRRCSILAEEMSLDSMTSWLFKHLGEGDSAYDLRSALSRREYTELDSTMRSHWSLPLSRFPHAKPWMLFALNSRPEKLHVDEQTFLDAHLMHLARLEGMDVIGLESMDEQGELFDQLAENDLARFFGFGYLDGVGIGQETLTNLYVSGDVEGIRAETGRAIPARVVDLILTRRNHRMAERIDALIRRARTFTAIGAAHLGGEEGVIALLRRRGYTLRPVTPVRTGLARKYVPPKRELPWIPYVDTLRSYAVEVPAPPVDIPLTLEVDLGARLLIDVDNGTGIGYGIVTMMIPTLGGTDPSTFADAMLESERFKKDRVGSVEKKSVTLGGVSGVEASFVSRESGLFRIRVFQNKGRVYCLYAMLDQRWHDQPDVDRYFASFKLLDTASSGRNGSRRDSMIEVRSERGAFALTMPADTHSMAFRVPDGAGDSVSVHFIFGATGEGAADYLVCYQDAGGKFDVVDDSLSLALRLAAMAKAFGGTLERDSAFLYDSCPAREVSVVNKQGIRFVVRAILRGDRTYVLGTTGHSADELLKVAGFNASLRLLPSRSVAWREFSSDSLPCSALLPGPADVTMARQSGFDSIYVWERIGTLCARDSGSAILYVIDYRRLGRRYRADDTAALFDDVDERFGLRGDSVIGVRSLRLGSDPARETIASSSKSRMVRRSMIVLHGPDLFVLRARVPRSEVRSHDVDRFFDSFRATGSASADSVFESDLPAALADIDSGDSSRAEDARRLFRTDHFGRRDLPIAYAMLEHPRPDDSVYYRSVRGLMISIVRSHPDSLAVRNLARLVAEADTPPALRSSALHAVAAIPTDEARDTLLAVFRRRPDLASTWSMTMLLGTVKDSILGRWMPSLMSLDRDARTIPMLVNGAADVLGSDSLALAPLLPRLRAAARSLIASGARNDSTTELATYALSRIASVLPPGSANDSLLRAMLDLPDLQDVTSAALALDHHGAAVPGSVFERIAASPHWRSSLYHGLDSAHRSTRFPARYRTQRFFAEGAVYDLAGEDEEIAIDSTIFVAEREGVWEKGRRRFFLFNVHADSVWRPIVIGPVPLDRNDVSVDDAYYWLGEQPFESRKAGGYFDEALVELRKSLISTKKEEDDADE